MSEKVLTEEEKKAKSKAAHRASMIGTGVFMGLCGLAGGWIHWGGKGELPSFLYGPGRPSSVSMTRRAKPGLVKWRPWGKESLGGTKLVLLDLRSSWSRAAALMEETTWSDPETARWIEENLTAVRVDADERPDLALRYLSGGWPTTALLLPTGEILDAGTYMTPKQFLPWAKALNASYTTERETVLAGVTRAKKAREEAWADRGRMAEPEPQAAKGRAAKLLSEAWKKPPLFIRWPALKPFGGPADSVSKLEDPVWGGFYRYAAGAGWTRPETEKRLADQAEALLYDADPERRKRTAAYVKRFLTGPDGWYNAQAPEVHRPDGHVVEGSYYFDQSEERRLALGLPAVDRRVFVGPNALMARALKDGRFLDKLKPTGRLGEDVELAHALATLGRKPRARSILAKLERDLDASGTPALLDRPAKGELPEGLDRILFPELNARLLELYLEFPELDAGKRAPKLKRWLAARSEQLDPALWAKLAAE